MGKIVFGIEVDSVQDLFQRLLRVFGAIGATYSTGEEWLIRLQLRSAVFFGGRLGASPHESKEVTILKMRNRTVWVQFQSALKFFLRFRPVPIVSVNEPSESAVPFPQFVVEVHCFLRS